ncbi:Nucleotide-binding universal stress protein, UspA family [Tenacibaculum litopenaei]|uniref:universal stress protein n=1 Tax=Tenacibaculum litopenaei TaxID=396016 RepID=UPI003894B7BE
MIHKIIVGIAFSPNLKANFFEAIRLANTFNAELIGVHVGVKTTAKEKELETLLKSAPLMKAKFTAIWQDGDPANVIIETATELRADLLIIGALQRENLYKYYVGSIARKITRKSPCSVLLFIKPSVERVPCNHMVVNGLENHDTQKTLQTAFYVSRHLGCKRVTIVDEIDQKALKVNVCDDKTLQEATVAKENMTHQENERIQRELAGVNIGDTIVKTQSIFGKRGYSIGHYAKVKRADLLVMNAPQKTSLLDRIFPHDLEYILSDLPTDVLIVK